MSALTIYVIIGLICGAIVNYASEEVAKKTNDEKCTFWYDGNISAYFTLAYLCCHIHILHIQE